MAFDPLDYTKEKKSLPFDPSKYGEVEEDLDSFDPLLYTDQKIKQPTGESISAGEAFQLGAADVIPGLGALTAGTAAKLGELASGAPVDEAEAKLKELGIVDPHGDLGSFTEAKREHVKKEEKAFDDQPMAYLGGSIVGGGYGTAKAAGLGLKLASKGGKAASLANILPSFKGAKKAMGAAKLAKQHTLLGNLDAARKYSNLASATAGKIAAREGAKVGALTGLVKGDADDLLGTAKQTAMMSAFSAGTGGAMSSAGSKIATGLKNSTLVKTLVTNVGERLSAGYKNINTSLRHVEKPMRELGESFYKSLLSKKNSVGGKISSVIKELDNQGVTINSIDELKTLKDGTSNPKLKEKLISIIALVDDYLPDGVEYNKGLKKLQDKSIKAAVKDATKAEQALTKHQSNALKKAIKNGDDIISGSVENIDANGRSFVKSNTVTSGNKGITSNAQVDDVTPYSPNAVKEIDIEGQKYGSILDETSQKPSVESLGPATPKFDVENMSPAQTKTLLSDLYDISQEAGLAPNTKRLVAETREKIKKKLYMEASKKGLNLEKLDKQYNNMSNMVKDVMKQKPGVSGDYKDKDIRRKMFDFVKDGYKSKDITSEDELDHVWNNIQNDFPDTFNEFRPAIEQARKTFRILEVQDRPALKSWNPKGLLGDLQSLLYKSAKGTGAIAGGTKDLAKNGIKYFVKLAPEQLLDFTEKIAAKGGSNSKHYITPLLNAVHAPERQRQALLFGMYSSPAFREILLGKPEKKEDDN